MTEHNTEEQKRFNALKKIRDTLVSAHELPLYAYRKQNDYFPVIGQGSHFANIMFIGEAPGEKEAQTGTPFCGRAGALLDELLASISVPRSDVYITNIVKDRPPDNRDPHPDEIAAYQPYLEEQIEIIKPKVVATLGRFSMNVIMKQFSLEHELGSISSMHGRSFEAQAPYGKVNIVPLYHPAVGLYNGSMRDVLKEDFKILLQFA